MVYNGLDPPEDALYQDSAEMIFDTGKATKTPRVRLQRQDEIV